MSMSGLLIFLVVLLVSFLNVSSREIGPRDLPHAKLPASSITSDGPSIQTQFSSYPGLTANSVVTVTNSGKPTAVPLWYCGPTATAAACKNCPSATSGAAAPSCSSGFNGILVIPIVPLVPGAFVPPPEGLPTLSVGPDGGPTEVPSDIPNTPTSIAQTSTSTTSSSTTSVPFVCPTASLRAADLATSVQSVTSTPVPPAKTVPDPGPSNLPVLPISNADPAQPTAFLGCGPNGDIPGFPGGFYQSGTSFSRTDGNNAISSFCQDAISKQRVIGPKDVHPEGSPIKAIPSYVQTYTTSQKDRKIMIRVDLDVDNKSKQGCPSKNNLYNFALDGVLLQCKQYLGQAIDYCDKTPTKSPDDPSWKNGGTFATNCFYFTVILSPSSGDSQITP